MRLSLAAARNDALIICMRLLTVTIRTRAIYRIQIMASLSDEDAVYLIESVVRGLHICKRMFARGLQLTHEDRNNERAFKCRYSLFVCRAVG